MHYTKLFNERESIINTKDGLLSDIKNLDGTVQGVEKTQQRFRYIKIFPFRTEKLSPLRRWYCNAMRESRWPPPFTRALKRNLQGLLFVG